MHELIIKLEETRRMVASGELNDAAAHTVELRRRFRAPAAEVWDACTDPDRVQRWFCR